MTRTQFRWILSAYVLVVFLDIALIPLTKCLIPVAVRELEPAMPTQCLPLFLLLVAFVVGVLGASFVAIIGMFCFWAPSRWIFLITALLLILSSPIMEPWFVKTGWSVIPEELEFLLAGVILTLSLVGPAKHLFRSEQKESNQASQESVRTFSEQQR